MLIFPCSRLDHSKRLERYVAVEFAKHVEEPLVVTRPHVEELDEKAVTALGLLQSPCDDLPHCGSCQITRHQWLINHLPERFTAFKHPAEKGICE